jgi:hypothetical protein
MIGEYTMNEYKTYKALVKHKRRINRVFTEVCGDKSFNSRRSGRKLKVPAVAVARCSAAPISAPRRRSSKRGPSVIDESTSSGVQPSRDLWNRRSVSTGPPNKFRTPNSKRLLASPR